MSGEEGYHEKRAWMHALAPEVQRPTELPPCGEPVHSIGRLDLVILHLGTGARDGDC